MIKHFFIVAILLFNGVLGAYGQKDSSGIYLNTKDFKNKKLSFAINCLTERHKIRLNDFFIKNYITVIHNNEPYKLYKDNIYGYKACDGSVIRFLKKKELLLLNNGETIAIYRYDVAKPPRGKTNVTNYYFSKDGTSQVFLLTISNLKKVYPDNRFFQQEIGRLFKYNTELAAYDTTHNMYKLNWVFNYSISNSNL